MTNKSKGEYAYTLLDLESTASKEALEALKAIEGVAKVRVINKKGIFIYKNSCELEIPAEFSLQKNSVKKRTVRVIFRGKP